MLAPEVISTLEKYTECCKRQYTPRCDRKCSQCDTCATKSQIIEAMETALKVIKFVEEKRRAHEQSNSQGQ